MLIHFQSYLTCNQCEWLLISHLKTNTNKIGKPTSWWNELVATGLFAVILGIFLIVLNCLISKREEDDLEEYVQRQVCSLYIKFA